MSEFEKLCIPIRPTFFYTSPFCGECDEEIRWGDKRCKKCGRVIDWSLDTEVKPVGKGGAI